MQTKSHTNIYTCKNIPNFECQVQNFHCVRRYHPFRQYNCLYRIHLHRRNNKESETYHRQVSARGFVITYIHRVRLTFWCEPEKTSRFFCHSREIRLYGQRIGTNENLTWNLFWEFTFDLRKMLIQIKERTTFWYRFFSHVLLSFCVFRFRADAMLQSVDVRIFTQAKHFYRAIHIDRIFSTNILPSFIIISLY